MAKKYRLSVTLTSQHMDALNELVNKGAYLDKGEAVRAGIRLVFKRHNLEIMSKPLRDQYE